MYIFELRYFWYAYAALNIVVFGTYACDKMLALLHKRRISERTLITLTLLFGGVGALLSMVVCRHKIRHPKFWFFGCLSILIQILIVIIAVW